MVALILCLALGTSLIPACAFSPVVVAGSATAAALVREVEILVLEGDKSGCMAVDQKAVVYAGPGEEYAEIVTLSDGVEVQVLQEEGEWIQCRSGGFEGGWIHISEVKDI
jgi:uncharacterized protein YgiM (DUF1202 family)